MRKLTHVLAGCLENICTNPMQESTFLMQDLLGKYGLDWIKCLDERVEATLWSTVYQALSDRLIGHKPFSRFMQRRFFCDHWFDLNPFTLDPRPETEGLVEWVVAHTKPGNRILDLGTGCGCILLSVLAQCEGTHGIGTDLDPKVFDVAQKNAEQMNLQNRITWRQSNWFDNLKGETFDIIVSNPPYISQTETPDPCVSGWDPPTALWAGTDGLDAYRRILSKVSKHLNPDGIIFFEIGHTQASEIINLMNRFFVNIFVFKDLCEKDRYIRGDFLIT